MNVKRMAIAKIKTAAYNPRIDLKPDDRRYQAIAKSLDEFGLVQPVVVNERTGTLVAGHQRLKVLQARGETHVDAVVVRLSLAKEKALNLALNKVSGDWDQEKLVAVLDELIRTPEIDIEVSGFALPEIEALVTNLAETLAADDEAFDVEADLASDLPNITQPGDRIDLGLHGEHRLVCADATAPGSIERLMGDQRAQLCHADPPYGVSFDPRNRPGPKKPKAARRLSERYAPRIRNDDLQPEQYRSWFETVAAMLSKALVPGAAFYIWNGHRNFGLMHDLLIARGFKVASTIVWAKESFAPSFGDYNERVEFCLYGWKGGARHAWYGPKNASTLWEIHRDRTSGYRHPTQKALELAERAIRNSSKRGDIVFDPFLGSGTTLIGAARLGRRCFGLEIEPRYCDTVVRRYIALAGAGAVPRAIAKRYASKEVAR